MKMNLHIKDSDGKHRIVAGDTGMLMMNQGELRRMIFGETNIVPHHSKMIFGCIIGGKK